MSVFDKPFDTNRDAALVTGAGNGIGLAIAQALVGEGVRTIFAVLCISRHQHQLVRGSLYEEHILLFSWGYVSWRNRMLSLP
jgi:NAD(P)-dependent dehydrogenase (short-subunit alcohol dehydrogenase family)